MFSNGAQYEYLYPTSKLILCPFMEALVFLPAGCIDQPWLILIFIMIVWHIICATDPLRPFQKWHEWILICCLSLTDLTNITVYTGYGSWFRKGHVFWCRSYIDMFYMVIKYKILLRPKTSLFTRKHLNYFQLYVVISLDRLQHCCYSLFQIFCSLDTTNTQTVNSSSAASLGAFSPNLTHLPTFYERQWKGKINQRVPLANQILAEATRANKVWEKSAEGSRGCRNAAGSHWVMTQERKCS